jgi:hypothetical protein
MIPHIQGKHSYNDIFWFHLGCVSLPYLELNWKSDTYEVGGKGGKRHRVGKNQPGMLNYNCATLVAS